MEWKTDWDRDSYIDISDINRITGNIRYLQTEFLRWQYHTGKISVDKVWHDFMGLLGLANEIEDSVQFIAENTVLVHEFRKKINQAGNTPFWDDEDLNRIERNLKLLYEILESIIKNSFNVPLVFGAGLWSDMIQA